MASNSSEFSSIIRGIRQALGDFFASGKLDAGMELNIEVLFGLLGALASADIIVTTHEAKFVNSLIDELKLPLRGHELAAAAFERGRNKLVDVKSELARFLAVHPASSREATQLYDSLLRLGGADGRLRGRERELLTEVTAVIGYPAEMLDTRLKELGLTTSPRPTPASSDE